LYIQDVKSSVLRPAKELKGFKKVFLKAGQTKTVELMIDKTALSFWDEKSKQWDVEPGAFKALVGSSSRDIDLEAEFTYQ
ncbi:MAG: fibronectin type III-like domain-contianing protein, partial [Planctomycetota bacterium]